MLIHTRAGFAAYLNRIRVSVIHARFLTGVDVLDLTASKIIRAVHDSVEEARARTNAPPHAAVVVQVELVVLCGHVYSVTAQNANKQGSARVWNVMHRTSKGGNAEILSGVLSDERMEGYTYELTVRVRMQQDALG